MCSYPQPRPKFQPEGEQVTALTGTSQRTFVGCVEQVGLLEIQYARIRSCIGVHGSLAAYLPLRMHKSENSEVQAGRLLRLPPLARILRYRRINIPFGPHDDKAVARTFRPPQNLFVTNSSECPIRVNNNSRGGLKLRGGRGRGLLGNAVE